MQSFIKASSVVYWGFNACKHQSWNLYVSTFRSSTSLLNRHIWEKKNKKGKTANLIPSFRAVKWMSKLGFIRCSFHLYSKLFTKFKIFRKVLPFYLVLNSKCSVRGGTLFNEDLDWLNFSLKATNLLIIILPLCWNFSSCVVILCVNFTVRLPCWLFTQKKYPGHETDDWTVE